MRKQMFTFHTVIDLALNLFPGQKFRNASLARACEIEVIVLRTRQLQLFIINKSPVDAINCFCEFVIGLLHVNDDINVQLNNHLRPVDLMLLSGLFAEKGVLYFSFRIQISSFSFHTYLCFSSESFSVDLIIIVCSENVLRSA